MLLSRYLTFGGASVHLEYTEGRAARIVDVLFRDVSPDDSVDPHINIRVRENRETGALELLCAGELCHTAREDAGMAQVLLDTVGHHLAAGSQTGVVLHAAALAGEHTALLLPGRSGVGKTTLAACLVSEGFRYLSDELVHVPEGSLSIEALARPLKIKKPAGTLLREHLRLNAAHRFSNPHEDIVSLAPAESGRGGELGAVVFPTFDPEGSCRLERLSRARVAFGLMGCLLNARNLAGHGFEEVTRLARKVPGFGLRFGDLRQIRDHVDLIRSLTLSELSVPGS